MATQRLTVATLAGQVAALVADRFARWRAAPDPVAVGQFCLALRENSLSLPVVYFAEWVDRWLMGDAIPGPHVVEGRRYSAACLSPEKAVAWAEQCGNQFVEQEWLASRLREAAAAWDADAGKVVVMLREVVGGSATDEEIQEAVSEVPGWLSTPGHLD